MKVDAVVVGGGPAGAACARLLAMSGARCAVVERERGRRVKPGEVLASAIAAPLAQLGLGDRLRSVPHLRGAGTVGVWNGQRSERPAIVDPLGGAWFVDRWAFDAMLLDGVRDAGGAVLAGSAISSVRRTPGTWRVALEGGATIAAPFLVDATGRGASPAPSRERDRIDSLAAILCYTRSTGADLRLFIESARGGWWYAAPLPAHRLVIGFLTDADLLPRSAEARTTFFRERLAETTLIRERCEGVALPGVVVAPAMTTLRRVIGGEGWVALGDAAATYDPLSGIGVIAALHKGCALARLLNANTATAARAYEDAERAAFDDYLHARRVMYASESRWRDAPFWSRRVN